MGPFAIPLSIAFGAIQSGLAIRGQQQAAKAQYKAQQQAKAAENQRALQQMSAERIQEAFQNEERSKEIQLAANKAREARSRATVAAGESGVAGLSVDALLNDFTRQEATYRFGLQRQGQQMAVARDLRLKDMGLQSYNTQIAINKPIQQPDYAGTLFGGVSSGLSIYSATKK
jgi:hypothetical protein